MFSKEERKTLNTEFWTRFKEKAGINKGANGKRINWVNYPIGVKQIHVRLHADTEISRFSIEIQDKDESIRLLVWEQFEELKKVLEQEMLVPGTWEKHEYNIAGQPISRISWTLEQVNMYKKEDRQKIYDFL